MEDNYILNINEFIRKINEELNIKFDELKKYYFIGDFKKNTEISEQIKILKDTINQLQQKLKKYNHKIYITKFDTECYSKEQMSYINSLYDLLPKDLVNLEGYISFLDKIRTDKFILLKNLYKNYDTKKITEVSEHIAALNEVIMQLNQRLKKQNIEVFKTAFDTECYSKEQKYYLDELYAHMFANINSTKNTL